MSSTFRQIVSGAVAKALVSDVLAISHLRIKASANTVFLGGPGVVSTNGIQVPSGDAAPYLDIDVENPSELYVIGTGTVYMIFDDVVV